MTPLCGKQSFLHLEIFWRAVVMIDVLNFGDGKVSFINVSFILNTNFQITCDMAQNRPQWCLSLNREINITLHLSFHEPILSPCIISLHIISIYMYYYH